MEINNKGYLAGADVVAGFPSPADDFKDIPLDLNKKYVHNPSSTFFVRVKGDSMHGAGIDESDLLIVDKSLTAMDGDIAICFLNGEFTVKKLQIKRDRIVLVPANDKYRPIEVPPDSDFLVWGVVRHIIKTIR